MDGLQISELCTAVFLYNLLYFFFPLNFAFMRECVDAMAIVPSFALPLFSAV